MKILWLHNAARANHTGGEDTVANMEEALLRSRGEEIIKYDRRNDEFTNYNLFQKASLFWNTSWSKRSYNDVTKLIRTRRPEIAHVHNYFPLLSPAVIWACHDQGVPVVLTLHNYRMLCCNGIFHRNGDHCHECVEHGPWRGVRYGCVNNSKAQTAAAARMIQTHQRLKTWQDAVTIYIGLTEYGIKPFLEMGIPRDKIEIKPHFIDPDPGVGRDLGYALFVGRLIENKGVRQLVDVWSTIDNLPLKIVGEGPLGAELREQAAAMGANIQFLGLQPSDEVLQQLHGARVLLVPSLHREGFPRVVTEGLACGVPIIASNVEPLPSIVQDGDTGLIFAARNLADLQAKIEQMNDDVEARQRMRHAARVDYENNYNADSNYQRLVDIYRQAIAQDLSAV
jgi:glycosyltransferase involved in cell wall biosynthesis